MKSTNTLVLSKRFLELNFYFYFKFFICIGSEKDCRDVPSSTEEEEVGEEVPYSFNENEFGNDIFEDATTFW